MAAQTSWLRVSAGAGPDGATWDAFQQRCESVDYSQRWLWGDVVADWSAQTSPTLSALGSSDPRLTAVGVRSPSRLPLLARYEFRGGPVFEDLDALREWLPWMCQRRSDTDGLSVSVSPRRLLDREGDEIETVLESFGFQRNRMAGMWATLIVDLHPSEDGILRSFNLINAFAEVARDYLGTTLLLIGYAPLGYREELLSMADGLGLSGRVEFAGSVQRQQLPAMLVLLRRDGPFSRAGFLTKLARYLATGRPVVVTSTGDIPLYLEHGVSAYLSPPGDVSAFASQMQHVLDHPGEAREAGIAGRAVARERFDCRLHASWVIGFLPGL